jgi:hypothetical protein
MLVIGLPIWKSAILSAFLGFKSNTNIFYESSATIAFKTSDGPP